MHFLNICGDIILVSNDNDNIMLLSFYI